MKKMSSLEKKRLLAERDRFRDTGRTLLPPIFRNVYEPIDAGRRSQKEKT